MKRIFCVLLFFGLAATVPAVVVFDGTTTSSLDVAIQQAIDTGDNVVEIRTNATLTHPYSIGLASATIGSVGGSFTIRAGEGFTPVLNQRIQMYYGDPDVVRSDLSAEVVLEGLTLVNDNDNYPALIPIGNVTVRNCSIARILGGSTVSSTPYPYTLTLENCTVNSGNLKRTAVQCRYYQKLILRNCQLRTDYTAFVNQQYECVLMEITTDMPPEARDDKQVILEGCTLTVKDEGYHIRYPWSHDPHRLNGVATVGTASPGHEPKLEATNCVFICEATDPTPETTESTDRVEASMSLLGTKNKMDITFKHCTWRKALPSETYLASHAYVPMSVAVYIRDTVTGATGENLDQKYVIQNCLFDNPGQLTGAVHSKTFGVLVENPAGDVTTGSDGNVYNWWGEDSVSGPGGNGYVTGPVPNLASSNVQTRLTPFEATRVVYAAEQTQVAGKKYSRHISTSDGHLPQDDIFAVDQAVALTPALTTDIDGDTRPNGMTADVGADELIRTSEVADWSIYR